MLLSFKQNDGEKAEGKKKVQTKKFIWTTRTVTIFTSLTTSITRWVRNDFVCVKWFQFFFFISSRSIVENERKRKYESINQRNDFHFCTCISIWTFVVTFFITQIIINNRWWWTLRITSTKMLSPKERWIIHFTN